MKAAYTREIINPILPCKMEGYNEARFCFNQTAQQKQVSGEGLRTACGLRDDLLLDTLILQAGETMVFFTLDIAIAEQQFTETAETISCVGQIGKDGMKETDREILKIMLEH